MKKLTMISVVVLAQVFVFNWAFAQKPEVVISDKAGWHKIGAVDTDLGESSESMSVMGADQFKAIKFKVTEAPANVRIEKATIIYESNNRQDITIGREVAAGQETDTYNLDRPTDDIKTVTFTYAPMPNYKSEKAKIELYGLK
jgi:hypothetical protein